MLIKKQIINHEISNIFKINLLYICASLYVNIYVHIHLDEHRLLSIWDYGALRLTKGPNKSNTAG